MLAALVVCGVARALVDAGGLEDQARGRRGLGDEGERAVFIDRDLDRDDRSRFWLSVAALYCLQNSMMFTPC